MEEDNKITLAIESAIAGGSLSLFRGDKQIASWLGTSNVSKAEDLLFSIDQMLSENGLDRRDVDRVAVSAGPGSFTGIRIGIATGLGLKMGLGAAFIRESTLKAVVWSTTADGRFTSALPVGRDAVCIQSFERWGTEILPLDEPHAVSEKAFTELVVIDSSQTFLVHERIYSFVADSPNALDLGSNLAGSIAKICINNPGTITEPLFISKNF